MPSRLGNRRKSFLDFFDYVGTLGSCYRFLAFQNNMACWGL